MQVAMRPSTDESVGLPPAQTHLACFRRALGCDQPCLLASAQHLERRRGPKRRFLGPPDLVARGGGGGSLRLQGRGAGVVGPVSLWSHLGQGGEQVTSAVSKMKEAAPQGVWSASLRSVT